MAAIAAILLVFCLAAAAVADDCNATVIGVCWYNCTLAQGFWKTHAEVWPPGLPDTTFFLSGTTWIGTYDFESTVGNCYFKMSHHWIAAYLNLFLDPAPPAAVLTAMNLTRDAFEVYTPAAMDSDPSFCISVADPLYSLLTAYTAGELGTSQCGLNLPCDSDFCTVDWRDELGVCHFNPRDCSDSDYCTDDGCDSILSVCTHTQTVCDDADPCTLDSCTVFGYELQGCLYTPLVCDDGDPCTAQDACDVSTGECVFPQMECIDGATCTVDACVDGQCVFVAVNCSSDSTSAVPPDCDDGDECTVNDRYDDELQRCVYDAKNCSDGDECSVDSCLAPDGTCAHVPKNCEINDLCEFGSCDPLNGDCITTAKNCSDGDPCSADTCRALDGACVHTPLPADDDDNCTTDYCVGGFIINIPIHCDDGDPCSVDGCGGSGTCFVEPRLPPACDPNATCSPCEAGDENCTLRDAFQILYKWNYSPNGTCSQENPSPSGPPPQLLALLVIPLIVVVMLTWRRRIAPRRRVVAVSSSQFWITFSE